MPNIGQEYTECYIEIPAQMCVDLKAKMTAEFYETGGTAPASIIRCNQASGVKVKFDFTDSSELKRLLCGNLCVKVAYESCGKGAEDSVVKWVKFQLCDKLVYEMDIEFPANYFCPEPLPIEDCGTVFCLCISVVLFDDCRPPKPIGVGAYCKGPCILVMP
ncbi:MAG: hypothetical protein KA368_05330 [Acidobacteria bacterium]|nr:hypothetical protein [Acidobacteriota bacterium]